MDFRATAVVGIVLQCPYIYACAANPIQHGGCVILAPAHALVYLGSGTVETGELAKARDVRGWGGHGHARGVGSRGAAGGAAI